MLNGTSPDPLCVELSYCSCPCWLERRSSRLSSFVPRGEGSKWSVARVLPGCHWVVEARAMRKWFLDGRDFDHAELRHPRNELPGPPFVTGKQGQATIGSWGLF